MSGSQGGGFPSIGDAKRLATKHRLRRCVIVFETESGQCGYSSYGETKALCTSTRELMEDLFDDLEHRIHFASAIDDV